MQGEYWRNFSVVMPLCLRAAYMCLLVEKQTAPERLDMPSGAVSLKR